MIYFFGAVLDRVDGFVARRTGQMSQLGNELDTVSDALGMAVARRSGVELWSGSLVLSADGCCLLPVPCGSISQTHARSAHLLASLPCIAEHGPDFKWAIWWWHVALVLPAGYPNSRLCFMLPTLTGFVIDWLVVSGRLERDSEVTRLRFDRLSLFSHAVLQPGLRLAIITLLAFTLWRVGFPPVVIGGAGLAKHHFAGQLCAGRHDGLIGHSRALFLPTSDRTSWLVLHFKPDGRRGHYAVLLRCVVHAARQWQVLSVARRQSLDQSVRRRLKHSPPSSPRSPG